MKIGVFTSNTNFLKEIVEEMAKYHDIRVYKHSDVDSFNLVNMIELMRWSDVAYFEFLNYLEIASNLDGIETPIVARLQGIEIYHLMSSINFHRVNRLITTIPQRMRLDRVDIDYLPKIDVLPVGVDTQFLDLPKDGKQFHRNIGIVGLICPRKRVYTSIQTLAPILGTWTLWIRGDFTGFRDEELLEYKSHIHELIDTLGVGNYIKFQPKLGREEYRRFLQDMDIVISNSTQEGYHVAEFEGMACGAIPLVNCWLGADRLYPPWSVFRSQTELLQKIALWDQMPVSEKKEKIKESRDWVVKDHDVKAVAKRIREIVEEVGKK